MNVEDLVTYCRARKIILATAESCTGGLIAAAITDIAGSSVMFDRGFVTYSNDAKQQMLGVQEQTLADHGAVSEEVAQEMAMGALRHSNANVAISVTGIAGPGGSDHKPEGRVCFGLATATTTLTETIEFGALGRDGVRQSAVKHALALLQSTITKL